MTLTLPSRSRTSQPLLAGLLLCALAACSGDTSSPPTPTDPLSQADGKWLLVNYWAEWCKPCLEEIPELQAFSEQHAERARVVMVNFDGATGPELQAQAGRFGIRLPLVETDPAGQLGTERPQVLPTTLVIAPDGTLRATLLGPQTVASLAAATGG